MVSGVGCIRLAQNRGQWRASVNTILNLWFLWKAENFLSMWANICFTEGICLVQLSFSIACLQAQILVC